VKSPPAATLSRADVRRHIVRAVILSWLMVIVPAIASRAAADAPSEDVPVPGGTAAFARALGIDPVPDRSQFVFEMTRLVHENPSMRTPSAAAFLAALAQPGARSTRTGGDAQPELVPVPLTADIWSRAVFRRKVSRDELVAAIVADHTASLLCHGLGALDDQTLQFFVDHSSLLTRLAERSAAAFAAFSGSLRIRANRVVPPGGSEAAALWEAVTSEKVTRPEAFVARLFDIGEGRLAYLFDTIGQLDPRARAFALGLWMPTPAVRVERFKVLATSGLGVYRDWHLKALPFSRGSYDLAMLLMRVSVDDTGAPRPPVARGFWARVFGGTDLPEDPARQLRGVDEEPFDLAWLAENVGSADVRQRQDRLDQIAFGQRRFADPSTRVDGLIALRAIPRYRMLILSLERMGVESPAIYAAAARHAARIGALDSHRGFLAHTQFQGALVLVARMTAVRTIDPATAEQFVQQVVSLPLGEEGRYVGAVARWIRDVAMNTVPPESTAEATMLAALSGPATADGDVTRVTWEGQRYRLDIGAAERIRLQRVREKQEAVPLDVPLDLADAGRQLAAEHRSIGDAQPLLARLSALAATMPERTKQEEEDNVPPGLAVPPEARAILRRTVEDLAKAVRNNDVKRLPRIGEPLLELSDELLSQTILSLAYACDLGDPDGTILLADDVSRRHDYGFAVKDSEIRARTAWMVPHQDVSPGVPWHVTGSLLGLDVALSPLSLRRMNFERVVEAPRLTSNQREAFALSVALLNPFALRDADRDAIADAIDRGRQRIGALGVGDLDAIGAELSLDGGRRRALAWALAHDRTRVDSMMTLSELMVLGGGQLERFDAWGMSMLTTMGCLCSRLTPPARWSTLFGRPQLGATAAGMADVNLQVAIRLKELQLPAPLARVVLAAAVQDYIDGVRPTEEADWITMTRAARAITREQVEDYLAAATAAGPLVPDNEHPSPW
jgi:hypothetical protein